MALKDIKELKKDIKDPIDGTKSGCCIFCGQSCLVKTYEEDPEKLNELATLECKCKGAIDYKRRKEKRMKIEDHIQKHFDPEVGDVVLAAVDLVSHYDLDQCQFKTPDGWNCKIGINNDGYIVFSHKKTSTEAESF